MGTVVHKGMAVRNGIQLCDKVWGTIPVHQNGSLAEYVAVDANFVIFHLIDYKHLLIYIW